MTTGSKGPDVVCKLGFVKTTGLHLRLWRLALMTATNRAELPDNFPS